MKSIVSVVAVSILAVASAFGDASAYIRPDAWGGKTYPPAPRIVEAATLEPAITLSAEGALDQLESLREWNAAGRVPARGGFERQIPDSILVSVYSAAMAAKGFSNAGRGVMATSGAGTTLWGTKIRILGAARVRLRLDDVKVPAGTVMWVYGNDGQEYGFDADHVDVNGGVWAPSVTGDTVHFEMEIPAKSDNASFTIRRVLQLLPLATSVPQPNDDASCLIDANCVSAATFPAVEVVRHAIAHLEIPVGGGFLGLCTGGLLADTKQSGTPYFLSAAHCFTDENPNGHPEEVSGMEIYWEYRTSSCNGGNPTYLTKTTGAQLLAGSKANDYAFFQLNSIPAGRGFLGWSASTVANGTALFRISHPAPSAAPFKGNPQPQQFTQTSVNTSAQTCTGVSRPTFIYEGLSSGATYGGSSGSPVMTADGKVVGQLYGKCGPTPNDGCDKANSTVDGAFAPNFESVYKQYLSASGVTPQPCVPSGTTICLSGGRFSVSVQYRDGGVLKDATAIKYTDGSGLFWFFGPDNIEILMKVLNACGLNNRIWVFSAATTNVEFHLKVVDTKTGTVKTYDTVAGPPAPAITDTSAFATCP